MCSEGLPTNNYFDLCAYYLLEFETVMKERNIKDKPLKELVEESLKKEKKPTNNNNTKTSNDKYTKLKENYAEDPLEKNLKTTNANNVIPKTKVY